ncbi:hypothetical protein IDG52_01475 [Pelagibacterales bacterium SAG-MED23]|nr:hypothetical protein [Pelagibacterales bacterium SAG-MED23]
MLIYLMPYNKVMFFFNKKVSYYLYIFFVFLTFYFIEFSTKEVFAKTFVVSKIEVEEKYNLNFNKLKVIDKGFKKAFQDLSKMILEGKDQDKITNSSIEDIKKLVDNFSILDEKFINQKYKSIIEVEFNRNKLITFLNSKNITLSLPKKVNVFFLPVLVDLENNSFSYLNDNILVKNWERINENYFQINYILPNEDVEDYLIIKYNIKNIESYNFTKILKKYNFENYIIMITFKNKNNIKFYSQVNFDDRLSILNKNFINKNLEDYSDLTSMILNIKNNYEDNWKAINKFNPSTSVPIRLSVESLNIKKSLKLENALSNLDFVNTYKIEKFDSNELIYKVDYSSSPKRFLKDILIYDIEVDTSTTDWKVK